MILKEKPEDFRVDEIYDLEALGEKKNESETGKLRFKYFKLWKRDYTVQRAIEQICRTFKIQIRDVHFAGTKDRVAVTTQLISMRRLRHSWKEDLEYFNNKNPDIKLEYIGDFPCRLNLGDNLGNHFSIVVRELNSEDFENLDKNLDKIKSRGVRNFFDSQRFGFGGRNPVIGKYLLRSDFKKAFFSIITAIPDDNQKEEHLKFVDYIEENFNSIVESNDWSEALRICPEWLRPERKLMEYVQKYKNDFLGAISLLPKKIRTLYVNSYQSYLFNETIKYLDSLNLLENYEELPLIASESELKDDWGEFVRSLMSRDGLNLDYFKMQSAPTLRPKEVLRKVFIPVQNLEVDKNEDEGVAKISFDLGSGSYATNVIKELFSKV